MIRIWVALIEYMSALNLIANLIHFAMLDDVAQTVKVVCVVVLIINSSAQTPACADFFI